MTNWNEMALQRAPEGFVTLAELEELGQKVTDSLAREQAHSTGINALLHIGEAYVKEGLTTDELVPLFVSAERMIGFGVWAYRNDTKYDWPRLATKVLTIRRHWGAPMWPHKHGDWSDISMELANLATECKVKGQVDDYRIVSAQLGQAFMAKYSCDSGIAYRSAIAITELSRLDLEEAK